MSTLNAAIPIRLRASDRASLANHFISLDADDRRLRFGSTISDEGLRDYARRIDFERDGVFAVHDDAGSRLLAVIHVALSARSAELGLSVVPECRGHGLGSVLFARAVNFLRNRGTPEVFVHCLTENGAMMHLARRNRMRIVPAGDETDARLALDPPTPHTVFTEWLHEYSAAAVSSVRNSTRLAKSLLAASAP